jgi:hypothetical protein
MSERNGDKARFQKIRKRTLLHRQRIRTLVAGMRKATDEGAPRQVDATLAPVTVTESGLPTTAMREEDGRRRTSE